MSHDIVKLLRDVPRGIGGHYYHLMQKAADEIERLRELSGDAGQLREERDEARREVCVRSCRVVRADRWMPTELVAFDNEEDVAKSRGWDCFKEVSHER